MRKLLFIGGSGSGKSVAARKLASAEPQKTYILNDREKPSGEGGKFFPVKWSKVLDLEDVNLIVEDLISCKPEEVEILQRLCNYNARHHRLPLVILIAHSITSNNIFQFVQFVTHVHFMNSKSTLRSLVRVLAEYRYPRELRDKMVADFAADRDRWGYWVLDVEARTFRKERSSSKSAETVSSVEECTKTAETYLTLFCPEPRKAVGVFNFIIRQIPLHGLNASDLSLKLQDAETKRPRSVSLLDFINCLMTPDKKPGKDVLALDRYLAKYLTLPDCFRLNERFK